MKDARSGAVPFGGRRLARVDGAESWPSGHYSGRRPASLFLTLLCWHLRIGVLHLVRDLLRTPQGWGLPFLVVVSIPALLHLATEGAWPEAALPDADYRAGALAVAHAMLVLCLAAMLPPTIVRDLASWKDREPLQAHPWALPEAGLARIVTGAVWTSAFLVLFFLLFHHPIVRAGNSAPAGAAVALGATGGAGWRLAALHAAFLFVYLAGLAALGLRVLAGWASRLPPDRSLQARHRLLIIPFLLTFPAMVLLPALLAERMPVLLSGLGGAAASGDLPEHLAGWLLQAPAAGVFLAGQGEAWGAAAWFGASLGVAGLAGLVLWRHRAEFSLTDPGVPEGQEPRRGRAFETAPAGPAPLRELRLFWEKDVRVRRGSAIWGPVREHGPVLVWIAVAAFLVPRLAGDPAGSGDTLVYTGLLPVVLAAGVSLRQGVPSLGLEGPQLDLLRALLPMRRLFVAKLSVNTLVVLPRAAGYAAAAALALSLAGVPTPGPGAALLLGAGSGALLSLAATAAGFLLPDLALRSPVLPGASLSGQVLFALLAGILVVGQGVALHLLLRGGVSAPGALALGCVSPALVGASSVLLATLALHRLENRDR